MADAEDLKSSGDFSSCGFDSHPGHHCVSCSQSMASARRKEFMRRRFSTLRISCLLIGAATCVSLSPAQESRSTPAYLGFDLNTYPGDDALPILRKTFSFAGYWLNPPPGAKESNWAGKRQLLLAQKFGFLLLYNGPLIAELKPPAQAAKRGTTDAASAAAAAKKEGFPLHAIIFLDIEEGGRLSENYHAYLRAWADDDACPPSSGCAISHNPQVPSASGVSYAVVWQFAQSPRRKQFTAHCAATYNHDGNCYAPGDTAHAWLLDLNSATTPDPSSGRGGEQ